MISLLNILTTRPHVEAFPLAIIMAFPLWFGLNWVEIGDHVITHIGPQGVSRGSKDDHLVSVVASVVVYLLTLRGQLKGGINFPVGGATPEEQQRRARRANAWVRHIIVPLLVVLPLSWLIDQSVSRTTLLMSFAMITSVCFCVTWLLLFTLRRLR
ncbi:hypothetical protein [Deinococcus xianganensis]|uniref:Uncharacterized protein n=1 Tax=Deinococcus xianganensis TaxID=1507289 RepID=A0A6I4YQX2_9DEIO|nr:hypothetical protein [Deinococcus xianganensis]MXV22086.1 hypothetical protein [Deinococcus xianganensis]